MPSCWDFCTRRRAQVLCEARLAMCFTCHGCAPTQPAQTRGQRPYIHITFFSVHISFSDGALVKIYNASITVHFFIHILSLTKTTNVSNLGTLATCGALVFTEPMNAGCHISMLAHFNLVLPQLIWCQTVPYVVRNNNDDAQYLSKSVEMIRPS